MGAAAEAVEGVGAEVDGALGVVGGVVAELDGRQVARLEHLDDPEGSPLPG